MDRICDNIGPKFINERIIVYLICSFCQEFYRCFLYNGAPGANAETLFLAAMPRVTTGKILEARLNSAVLSRSKNPFKIPSGVFHRGGRNVDYKATRK